MFSGSRGSCQKSESTLAGSEDYKLKKNKTKHNNIVVLDWWLHLHLPLLDNINFSTFSLKQYIASLTVIDVQHLAEYSLNMTEKFTICMMVKHQIAAMH